MKIRISILFILLAFNLKAQYISEVLEYVPAPGQLINVPGVGTSADANSIIGGVNGNVSLGSFGGYIVFRFDSAVRNDSNNPYGIDFTIFGNAYTDWSEPAAVWVMKDNNKNNLPDDNWYLLAGSDYYFNETITNYSVKYFNNTDSSDVMWIDSNKDTGYIYTNSFHTQAYYPQELNFSNINSISYNLKGLKINADIDASGAINKSYKRAFGFADNTPGKYAPHTLPDNPYTSTIENSGGDAFDIDWAVDSLGQKIFLDEIHFVKVQNCTMENLGAIGELSTEITGAVDIPPNKSIIGEDKIIIFESIPKIIDTSYFKLNAILFDKGHPLYYEDLIWNINSSLNTIDNEGTLNLSENGIFNITVSSSKYNNIIAEKSINVLLKSNLKNTEISNLKLYPNPVKNYLIVKYENSFNFEIIDLSGSVIKTGTAFNEINIDLKELVAGIYIMNIYSCNKVLNRKIIKL